MSDMVYAEKVLWRHSMQARRNFENTFSDIFKIFSTHFQAFLQT